jgi:hypothetical protein
VSVSTLLAMRRAYRSRRGPLLLRATAAAVLYGVTMALTLGGVALVGCCPEPGSCRPTPGT